MIQAVVRLGRQGKEKGIWSGGFTSQLQTAMGQEAVNRKL